MGGFCPSGPGLCVYVENVGAQFLSVYRVNVLLLVLRVGYEDAQVGGLAVFAYAVYCFLGDECVDSLLVCGVDRGESVLVYFELVVYVVGVDGLHGVYSVFLLLL